MLLRNVRHGLGGPVVDVVLDGGVVSAVLPRGTGPGEPLLDAEGGTVLPGLRDAHVHVVQWALARRRIQLGAAASAADAVAAVVAAAADRPAAEFLAGVGFRDGLWPDAMHKDLLQRALPDRAVALTSQDLHTLWLSPAALALLGLDHPTGVLVEGECFRASTALPRPDAATLDGWALDALAEASTRGVTSVDDYEYADTVADWTRRAASSALPVRIRCVIARHLLDTAIERGHRTGERPADSPAGMLTVGPLKLFVDGSLNTRTAWCADPYPGSTSHGQLELPFEQLTAYMAHGAEHGITPAVHAIGDAAATIALDAFAAVGTPGRVEHAQLLLPADLARFAALGVVAGVQPAHQPDDRDVADHYWAGRTDRAFPYRALADAGVVLELGSDAPVTPLDPWEGIAAAVTRTADERPAWHPEQALTLAEAVAASCGGRSTVAAGDPADVVVVAGDLATSADLRATEVLATVAAGRVTHRS